MGKICCSLLLLLLFFSEKKKTLKWCHETYTTKEYQYQEYQEAKVIFGRRIFTTLLVKPTKGHYNNRCQE